MYIVLIFLEDGCVKSSLNYYLKLVTFLSFFRFFCLIRASRRRRRINNKQRQLYDTQRKHDRILEHNRAIVEAQAVQQPHKRNYCAGENHWERKSFCAFIFDDVALYSVCLELVF